MKYAHIFKAPGKTWQLYITDTPSLQGAGLPAHTSTSKAELKQIAKALNAKAWNY